VRKLLGYRRFQGIAAAQAITRLYGASRLFVNFFQPSFKLAEKHRQGAQMSKRYHPPQTPCDRLLQAESIPKAAKIKLREVASALDPLKLLEEIRAMQAHLSAQPSGHGSTRSATDAQEGPAARYYRTVLWAGLRRLRLLFRPSRLLNDIP
jgi:hypothetical protein